MNHVKSFEKFSLNEAWIDANVNEPFDKQKELAATEDFEFKIEPIRVKNADINIKDEWNIHIDIELTNGDEIKYDFTEKRDKQPGNGAAPPFYTQTLRISSETVLDIANEDGTDFFDEYFGSSGTCVGDLLLIYRDLLEKKIPRKYNSFLERAY